MNLINEDLPRLAWQQVWQVTLLIAAVAVLVRLFCRHRPHLAYVLWMLVVVKCITPPMWSSPTGVFSWMQADEITRPIAAQTSGTESLDAVELGAEDELDSFEGTSATEAAGIAAEPITAARILIGVWFSGVVLLAAVVAFKWLRLHVRLKQTALPVDAKLSALVSRLQQKLGIRRPVRLLVTSEPFGPAVFGTLRPVVVLPQSLLEKIPAETVEPILAHELVHVRRFDSVAGLLQAAVQLAWWFHPLVWWANRQTSRERERCCDEEVVTGLDCPPAFYARSLLDVLELKRQLRNMFAVPGIRPLEITSKRVEDIMRRSKHFCRRMPWYCRGIALVGAALFLPGAGLAIETPTADSVETARPPEDEQKETKSVKKQPKETPVGYNSGLIHRLPKDGTWAKYQWISERVGENIKNSGTTTIRSVGRMKVDGMDCRWIELKSEFQAGGVVRQWIAKVLVTEKRLASGKGLRENILQGRIKYGDDEPVDIAGRSGGGLNAALGGEMNDVKKLDAQLVDSKLGKLECIGVTGKMQRAPDANGVIRGRSTFESRLHKKAPFGVVTRRWKLESLRNGKVFGTMISMSTLVDFGAGAKSELPDKGYVPDKKKANQQSGTK